MALPTAEQNGTFTHIYPVTDLGFTPVSSSDDHITLGDNATVAAASIFGTGVPATVLFLVQASAGDGTLKAKLGAAGFTPSYSSPDLSLAISGTALQVGSVNTDFVYDDSSILTTTISTDKRFVGVELVAGTGGLTLAGFAILVMYELQAGEDWFVGLRSSANAVANTSIGDGGGLLTLNPVASHSPYVNSNVYL